MREAPHSLKGGWGAFFSWRGLLVIQWEGRRSEDEKKTLNSADGLLAAWQRSGGRERRWDILVAVAGHLALGGGVSACLKDAVAQAYFIMAGIYAGSFLLAL